MKKVFSPVLNPIRGALLHWLGFPSELTNLSATQLWELVNTRSGKKVSVDGALQLSTVWACTRLISESVSTLPLKVYQTNSDGSRTLARSHPLYKILCKTPNSEYTPSRFMLMVVASICLWGNAFVEKKTTTSGRLIALDPLLPQTIALKRLGNGTLEYKQVIDGKERVIPENNMMHIRGFGIDGLTGLSVVKTGAETLGSAKAAEESASKFFDQGMQSSGFLSTEAKLSNDQRERLKKNLAKYRGSKNAGKLMVLEAGMTYQEITMNPEAAQLLQTRSFSIEEICRWFRTPPYMIGHMDKASSWASSVEAQFLHFLINTLRPLLINIEQEIAKNLLSPKDRESISIEFAVEGLLRADSKGRAEYYNSALNNGWMNRNEVRRKENLPPIKGGDVFTVQSALINLEDVGKNYDNTSKTAEST